MSMKQKITQALTLAKDQHPDKAFTVLVHPDKWNSLPETEQTELASEFTIDVPALERLDVMAKLMGVKNDSKFWDCEQIYLVPNADLSPPTGP